MGSRSKRDGRLNDNAVSDITVAFLDTNYCLHYPIPEHVDWPKALGTSTVRLVACLGMIHELDNKKDHPTLSGRAESWIKLIKKAIAGTIVVKKPNTTLEIFAASSVSRPLDANTGDAAIVEQVQEFIDANANTRVIVVTEDAGMLIRCHAQGINTYEPDRSTRKDNPASELQKQIVNLTRELHNERYKLPDIRLTIAGGTKDGNDRDPLFFTLRPPQADSFSKLIPDFLQRNGIRDNASAHFRQSYLNAKKTMEEWAAANLLVADESARTIALRLSLANVGRSPAKGLEITIAFPPDTFMAASLKYNFAGQRAPLKSCPHLVQRRQEWTNDGYRYIEPPSLSGAQPSPPNLNQMTMQLVYPNGLELDMSRFFWRLDELGHGKSSPLDPLYLTYASWESIKPAELSVMLYGSEPPFRESYVIKLLPNVDS